LNEPIVLARSIWLVSTFRKFLSKWPLKRLGPSEKLKICRLFFLRILFLEERDGGNLHILEAMRHLRREPTQNFKEAVPSPSYSGGEVEVLFSLYISLGTNPI
jgi:hypothetical protein